MPAEGSGHNCGVRTPAEALEALRALPCGARVPAVFAPGDGVHLVGGAVRDLLLEHVPREIDLVVEGDVEAAAARLGGDVEAHDRFGTATGRGRRLPLRPRARAARALRRPRRAARGRAVDARRRPAPPRLHGQRDRAGARRNAGRRRTARSRTCAPASLRVLHDGSFADDPTRLWRVARYAARLRLRRSSRTPPRWPPRPTPRRSAATGSAAELRLALREPDPVAALSAARALNPRLLPAGFDPDPPGLGEALALLPADGARRPRDAGRVPRRGDATRARCSAGSTTWASPPPSATSSPPRRAISTGAPLRAARRRRRRSPAPRAARRSRRSRSPAAPNARRWLDELRHVRLEITGDDLLAAGVPQGPGDRRAPAARAGPQARRRGRRPRRRARGGARLGWRRDGPPTTLRWDGAPRPLRGLLPHAHRPRAAGSACGSATRWSRRSRGRRRLLAVADGDGPRRRPLRAARDVPGGSARDHDGPVRAVARRRRRSATAARPARSRASRGSCRGSRAWRRTSTCTRSPGAPGSPTRCSCCAHADVEISGTLRLDQRTLELHGARGGQAHLWGSKHAAALGVGALQRPARARRRAAPGHVRRRRLGLRRALRARARPDHAGGRALPRRGLRRDGPAARSRDRAAASALGSWRFEARDGARKRRSPRSTPRDGASSA